jgi:hypothetical protein
MSTGGIAALALVEKLGTPPFDIGPYRCDERIGIGSTAEVLRAHDTRLESGGEQPDAVALKRQLPGIEPTREPERARAVRHPGVAALLDFGVDESTGRQYLVYELIDGRTLLQAKESGETWTPREAARIVAAVAGAMARAHALGVIHGDLKPDNIMLTPDGPKVIDLGSATRGGSEAPCSELFGAPEQKRGEHATTASDVYALGEILRWMSPALPRTLAAIARRATSHDQSARYQFAQELATDLDAWLAHRPIDWTKPGLARAWLFALRSPLAASLVVVALIIAFFASRAMLDARLESRLNELREEITVESLKTSMKTVDAAVKAAGMETSGADTTDHERFIFDVSAVLEKHPSLALQVEAVARAAEVRRAMILASEEQRPIPKEQAEEFVTILSELDAKLQEDASGGWAQKDVVWALGVLHHPKNLNDVERYAEYGRRLFQIMAARAEKAKAEASRLEAGQDEDPARQ